MLEKRPHLQGSTFLSGNMHPHVFVGGKKSLTTDPDHTGHDTTECSQL